MNTRRDEEGYVGRRIEPYEEEEGVQDNVGWAPSGWHASAIDDDRRPWKTLASAAATPFRSQQELRQ
jgi:hypothetical protein